MSAVLHLSKRVGSYEAALVAYRAADSRLCLQELRSIVGANASALRARASLRAGDPARALDSVPETDSPDMAERSEHAMLRAVALSRLGVSDFATQLDDARAYAISGGDHIREAEVEYYAGLTSFGAGDVAGARAAARRGLAAAGPSMAHRGQFAIPKAHIMSRLEELLGAVHTAEGNYDQQLFHAREALAILDNCDVKDFWQEGTALLNLCVLARDFDLPEDTALVSGRIASLPWTDDLRGRHFRSVDALSWCAMLRGDHASALRYFRQAASIASYAPDRIQVSVARAVHAKSLGHHVMAIDEIEYALDLAERFDWNAAIGDSREALLELAQVAIAVAPQRARTLLNRYNAIRTAIPTTYFSRLEARVRAEESFTTGIVLRAEGNLNASTDRLAHAFETWESIGYTWRASRAATELAELNAGDVFRFAVKRELRARPDSVFAERMRLVA